MSRPVSACSQASRVTRAERHMRVRCQPVRKPIRRPAADRQRTRVSRRLQPRPSLPASSCQTIRKNSVSRSHGQLFSRGRQPGRQTSGRRGVRRPSLAAPCRQRVMPAMTTVIARTRPMRDRPASRLARPLIAMSKAGSASREIVVNKATEIFRTASCMAGHGYLARVFADNNRSFRKRSCTRHDRQCGKLPCANLHIVRQNERSVEKRALRRKLCCCKLR